MDLLGSRVIVGPSMHDEMGTPIRLVEQCLESEQG